MRKVYTNSLLVLVMLLGFSACDIGMSNDESFGGEGKGGSLARFTILNNHLYVVDNTSLKTFDLSDPANPSLIGSMDIGAGVETIFPYEYLLFIGTQFGMQIFSVYDSPIPSFLSNFEHAFACDPVVVSGNTAYVTLRSGTTCRAGDDRLEVVDVTDLENPRLETTMPMLNPHGLSVSDSLLFICEGEQGFKVFNIKEKYNPVEIAYYDSIPSFDVISLYGKKELIITGPNGIYQFDYSDPYHLKQLSRIETPTIND
jgi:hypothetical protein